VQKFDLKSIRFRPPLNGCSQQRKNGGKGERLHAAKPGEMGRWRVQPDTSCRSSGLCVRSAWLAAIFGPVGKKVDGRFKLATFTKMRTMWPEKRRAPKKYLTCRCLFGAELRRLHMRKKLPRKFIFPVRFAGSAFSFFIAQPNTIRLLTCGTPSSDPRLMQLLPRARRAPPVRVFLGRVWHFLDFNAFRSLNLCTQKRARSARRDR